MKFFKYFMIGAFCSFLSWTLNAQISGSTSIPLSPSRTLPPSTTTVPTMTPNPSGPTRPSSGSGRLDPDGDSDRPVMWVHGHGGGAGSWDRASAATQNAQIPPVPGYEPRKVVSHPLDYSSSSNAISAAGSLLKTKMEGLGLDQNQKERAIVIAHSMGGLVSSYVDYLYDGEGNPQARTFDGLVTVGTPHKGAVLAANSYPYTGSMANQIATSTCSALTAGPLEEEIQNNFFLDLLFEKKARMLAGEFCNFLVNDIVTIALRGFNAPIANDLKPNSQLINLLQNFQPQRTHRIAFYGVLPNDDMIWKTYHYMKNSPNADGFFEADKAQESVDTMNKNKAKYVAKRDYWQMRQNYWQTFMDRTCWNPLTIPLCLNATHHRNEARRIKEAYQRGVSWWLEINDQYRLLVGDLSMGPSSQASCQCTNYNTTTGTYSGPVTTMGYNGNCTNSTTSPYYQFCNWVAGQALIDVDSDGIVLASSAMALPGASKHVKLQNDSHFQLVNSPRTKTALKGLWDSGYGEDFFVTPTK